MILLWGLKQDETMNSVLTCLEKIDAQSILLDHSKIDQTEITYCNHPSPSYELRFGQKKLNLNDFKSAYLRPYNYNHYDHLKENPEAIKRAANVHHWMASWAESSDALIINRSSSECSNQSKMYQALIISAAGFKIPDSLITNDYPEMTAFKKRHQKIIYKSMSSVRSIVKELENLSAFASVDVGPVLLQEYVHGKNIRVHVVGKKVFATLIESDQVDYRYGLSKIFPFELPMDIADRCIQLTERLQLIISGIDLILTATGEWFCLEVNPNPGFSFYDFSEANEIAYALALLLAK